MTDTGWLNLASFSNVNSRGVAWTNPSNAGASDNADASISVPKNGATDHLEGLNPNPGIPGGDTVDGIQARIERSTAGGIGTCADGVIQLIIGGTKSGNNKAAAGNWTATDTYVEYGGTTDLWGLTPTAADINGATMGLAAAADSTSGLFAVTAAIDHMQLRFHHSASLNTKTLTADAILQAIETKSATLSGIAVNQNSLAATLNAIAMVINTETTTLAGVLMATRTLSATLNAQISAGGGLATATLNAILQAVNTLTASLDAIIKTEGNQHTAILDAALAEILTLTLTMSAVVRKEIIATVTLDAQLNAGAAKTLTLSAIRQAVNTLTATFSGVLSSTDSLTATLNAQIISVQQLTAVLDGALRRTEAAQVTLDGYLEFAFGVWAPRAQASAAWSSKGDASGVWTPVDPADPSSWT